MKHTHKHISLLMFALITALGAAGAYAYMFYVVETSVRSALTVRQEAFQQKQYIEQEKEISAMYDATAADRARLASFFVADSAIIPFIETLESLGDTTGATVSLSGMSPDNLEGQPQGTLGSIKANVDIRGSWSAVMRTISLAEVLPYRVRIDHIRLDSSGILATSGSAKSVPQWNARFAIDAALMHVVTTQ